MKRAGATPPFRGPRGEPLPDSIAEAAYLRLGGIEQWVLIRGERATNPPLILLHGGPGYSETHFFRRYNAPLERAFTVVYWDQRGAGRSFDPNIPKASMTVARFISDLDELVDAVRARLGHAKVALFGHSWGTTLGMLYASRFPEKVALYVGCAQVADCVASERASYHLALREAERRQHTKALEELRAMGEPPYSAADLMRERMWLQRFDRQVTPGALWKLTRDYLACPEFSIFDVPNIVRGFRFSIDTMWSEVSTLNLTTLVRTVQMPVFFFVSRRDRWVPPEMSAAYFDALSAPSKQLVWFDDSAHEPFVDEPEKFNRVMTEQVRPAVDVALAA